MSLQAQQNESGRGAADGFFRLLPVRAEPFPHVVKDDWLEPEFYCALESSFPICPPGSGPAGHNLFWGDEGYRRLLDDSPEWRALFDRFHSQQFVDWALAQFEPVFREETALDLEGARYVPWCENREQKQQPALRPPAGASPLDLWVRMDLLQGRVGYGREAHLDHRRRAVSLLIYFCGGEREGGDLVLHGRDGGARLIEPRRNRMVVFPCHSESLHSVTPIEHQSGPRNFVQVTLSGWQDLWTPEPRVAAGGDWLGAARTAARRLFA